MPDQEDRLFRKIILKNRLLTEGEVDACLAEKERSLAEGRRKSLYGVLEEKGLLSPDQLDNLLRAYSMTRKIQEDAAYGQVAMREGFLTREQLEHCEERLREGKFRLSLGKIALEAGFIAPEAHETVCKQVREQLAASDSTAVSESGVGRAVQAAAPFDLDAWLARRRRRDLRLAAALAGGVLGAAVLVGWPLRVAYSNAHAFAGAQDLYAAGNYAEAARTLETLGAFGVDDEGLEGLRRNVAFKMATAAIRVHLAAGEWDLALAAWDHLGQAYPGDEVAEEIAFLGAQVYHDRGEERYRAQRYGEATDDFRLALARGQDRAGERLDEIRRELWNHATHLELDGEVDEAVHYLKIAAQCFPESAAAFREQIERALYHRAYWRGRDEFVKKNFARALERFEEARALVDTEDVGLWVDRCRKMLRFSELMTQGDALRDFGKVEEARSSYREALGYTDEDPERRARVDAQLRELDIEGREGEITALVRELYGKTVEDLRANRHADAKLSIRVAQALAPGDTSVVALADLVDRVPDMRFVASGEFVMGEPQEGSPAWPERRVPVEAFFIDRAEVTNRAYREFVKATGHPAPETWTAGRDEGGVPVFQPAEAQLPVTQVSWEDAMRFAAWRRAQLPTEVQWERAARGTDGQRFPWGREAMSRNGGTRVANIGRVGPTSDRVLAEPVGSYPEDTSPAGCMDMAGNLSEWTRDAFLRYPGGEGGTGGFDPEKRAIRGGSYRWDVEYARCAARTGGHPARRFPDVGLRCVVEIPEDVPHLR
ncbi:MAG: SUMF1/EgtB/PvdO family nonheme iron enzyme [Planctomycetes bacterium]|nr:SUMF1/EgtB/PvdO family nonheme iron enzyme [Planctomycetota bacterium]